jgi:hypothetical protein
MADVKLLSFEFSTPQQRDEYETTLAQWIDDGYEIAGTTAVEYPLNHILVVTLVRHGQQASRHRRSDGGSR